MSYLFPGNIGGFSNGAVRSNQVLGRSVYGLGPMFDILSTVDAINTQTLYNLGGSSTSGVSVLPTIDASTTGTSDQQAEASYVAQTAYVSLVNSFGSSTTLLQLQNAYKSLYTTLGVTIIWILNKLTYATSANTMTQIQAFYQKTSGWSTFINGILPLIDTLFDAVQLRDRNAANTAVSSIMTYLGGGGAAIVSLVGASQLNCSAGAAAFAGALFTAATTGTRANLEKIASLASQNP